MITILHASKKSVASAENVRTIGMSQKMLLVVFRVRKRLTRKMFQTRKYGVAENGLLRPAFAKDKKGNKQMTTKELNNLFLNSISNDPELLEVARLAIEDVLVEMRDSHMFVVRNNGLVIHNYDTSKSHVIRMGPETAMRIGLQSIALHLENKG